MAGTGKRAYHFWNACRNIGPYEAMGRRKRGKHETGISTAAPEAA